MTGFDLLLKVACGGCVTPADARAALLSSAGDCDEAARLDRVARIRARNEALRDAGDELGGSGVSAWELAGRMEAAVLRFEARVWPRVKAGFECALSPSDEALRRAFLTGLRIPKTQRHFYSLLA